MTQRILEISSISTRDYIYITANYLSLLRGDRDNSDELRARGYSEEQIKIAQMHKKVAETKTQSLKFTRDLTEFHYPLIGYLLILLENYERGSLPYPGPVSEQPAQIMETLSLMQSLKVNFKNEIERKQAEAAKRRSSKR